MSNERPTNAAISPKGSYCEEKSQKDRLMVFAKGDLQGPLKPETLKMLERDDSEPGIILPNGQINWNCPCLGNMASGPCAYEFRQAFSCFHYSDSEVKGANCMEQFDRLQDCVKKYPKLYSNDKKSE